MDLTDLMDSRKQNSLPFGWIGGSVKIISLLFGWIGGIPARLFKC